MTFIPNSGNWTSTSLVPQPGDFGLHHETISNSVFPGRNLGARCDKLHDKMRWENMRAMLVVTLVDGPWWSVLPSSQNTNPTTRHCAHRVIAMACRQPSNSNWVHWVCASTSCLGNDMGGAKRKDQSGVENPPDNCKPRLGIERHAITIARAWPSQCPIVTEGKPQTNFRIALAVPAADIIPQEANDAQPELLSSETLVPMCHHHKFWVGSEAPCENTRLKLQCLAMKSLLRLPQEEIIIWFKRQHMPQTLHCLEFEEGPVAPRLTCTDSMDQKSSSKNCNCQIAASPDLLLWNILSLNIARFFDVPLTIDQLLKNKPMQCCSEGVDCWCCALERFLARLWKSWDCPSGVLAGKDFVHWSFTAVHSLRWKIDPKRCQFAMPARICPWVVTLGDETLQGTTNSETLMSKRPEVPQNSHILGGLKANAARLEVMSSRLHPI